MFQIHPDAKFEKQDVISVRANPEISTLWTRRKTSSCIRTNEHLKWCQSSKYGGHFRTFQAWFESLSSAFFPDVAQHAVTWLIITGCLYGGYTAFILMVQILMLTPRFFKRFSHTDRKYVRAPRLIRNELQVWNLSMRFADMILRGTLQPSCCIFSKKLRLRVNSSTRSMCGW